MFPPDRSAGAPLEELRLECSELVEEVVVGLGAVRGLRCLQVEAEPVLNTG